ncbi:MAG: hypothetical protein PHD15_03460 [Clostridia bacterium]|nr:hypothetical protein [Clostridia bacterium]MDD4386799.1 hypothetical protein [Clostridia bacterium]
MYFLELVRKIKDKNIGKVCIVKSGIFYYTIDKYLLKDICILCGNLNNRINGSDYIIVNEIY